MSISSQQKRLFKCLFSVIYLTFIVDVIIAPAFAENTTAGIRGAEKEGLLSSFRRWRKVAWLGNYVGSTTFPNLNFVGGFSNPRSFSEPLWYFFRCSIISTSAACSKWNPPVKDEKMGIVSYAKYAKTHFGKSFGYDFFDDYYTGNRIPSWEDNTNHKIGMNLLATGTKGGRLFGIEFTDHLNDLEPRFPFDVRPGPENELVQSTWKGFPYFGPYDIKYASNGVHGIKLVNDALAKHNTTDALGILMTDSVFSAHLTYHEDEGKVFRLDLSFLEKYTPIVGYAKLGGKAEFVFKNGRLCTTMLSYDNQTYTEEDFMNDTISLRNFKERSLLTGWRFAEKAIIASLLSMTNLVMHVKDLHLELAATFQAVTVDAFASNPKHPIRRLLDPYIHRSVQATNDNFRLLFDFRAAEFSLAPLPYNTQLQLMQDSITEFPLRLDEIDMTNFGAKRGMKPEFSERSSQKDPNTWHWRWHYRALKVQNMYEDLINCWVDQHYGFDTNSTAILDDALIQGWWSDMKKYLPALQRTLQKEGGTPWAPEGMDGPLTRQTMVNFLRTMITWISWIHEDVGHSAAAYVYNPVHTPMCVPADGLGVPMRTLNFNALAYRGFVFLDRNKLLDDAPEHWFDSPNCVYSHGWLWWKKYDCTTPKNDKQCFTDFQSALRTVGEVDSSFSECDKTGYYSCVDRVETAVSS